VAAVVFQAAPAGPGSPGARGVWGWCGFFSGCWDDQADLPGDGAGFAGLLALRDGWLGLQPWRRVGCDDFELRSVRFAGPVATELYYTGATWGQWLHNVVLMPRSRVALLHAMRRLASICIHPRSLPAAVLSFRRCLGHRGAAGARCIVVPAYRWDRWRAGDSGFFCRDLAAAVVFGGVFSHQLRYRHIWRGRVARPWHGVRCAARPAADGGWRNP